MLHKMAKKRSAISRDFSPHTAYFSLLSQTRQADGFCLILPTELLKLVYQRKGSGKRFWDSVVSFCYTKAYCSISIPNTNAACPLPAFSSCHVLSPHRGWWLVPGRHCGDRLLTGTASMSLLSYSALCSTCASWSSGALCSSWHKPGNEKDDKVQEIFLCEQKGCGDYYCALPAQRILLERKG